MSRSSPSTWRDLRRELEALGAAAQRTRGSHEIWRFDDGATFVVVRNHLGNDVPTHILVAFRRLQRQRSERSAARPPQRARHSAARGNETIHEARTS